MGAALAAHRWRRAARLGQRLLTVVLVTGLAACSTPRGVETEVRSSPSRYVPAPPIDSFPAARAARGEIVFAQFATAPFPYRGYIPDKDVPFLDVSEGGRLGHSTPSGKVRWEDETYNDRRSLLFIPRTFDPRRPAVIVMYFHGNGATLARDVSNRQQIPRQVAASGLNAVLVAPQFAIDARDSSPGRFWQANGLSEYLDEAAVRLAQVYGDESMRDTFAQMPVVLVGYSGGYFPIVHSLVRGGANGRIAGVALFDALYSDEDKFAAWISQRGAAFFFSAYAPSTHRHNLKLQDQLSAQGIAFGTTLPEQLSRGSVNFLDVGDLEHRDLMTTAWMDDPLKRLLASIPDYPGAAALAQR